MSAPTVNRKVRVPGRPDRRPGHEFKNRATIRFVTLPTLDLPPPLFGFQLQVLGLQDTAPSEPPQLSAVSTFPNILINGQVQAWTADYEANTNYPGYEPVVIAIMVMQETAGQTIHGSIEELHGAWYWVGGGQRMPLAPDDPCVTRVWPEGRPMSDQDYDRFCKTRVIPGTENTACTFGLYYDLATEQISGDANGSAGTILDLHNGSIELSFTVNPLDARSFQRDILPLFRPSDISAMRDPFGPPYPLDLTSYQAVKANAQSINIMLNASPTSPTAHMPCDGWWPPGPLLVFQQWIDQGTPP